MLDALDEPLRIPKLDLALSVLLVGVSAAAVVGTVKASNALIVSYKSNVTKIENAQKALDKVAKPDKSGNRPNEALIKQAKTSRSNLNNKLLRPSPSPAGGSGGTTISPAPADGAPATAHNLSLAYDSMLAQPDQVIEADIGFSADWPVADTLSASLSFNGLAQPTVYFDMKSLGGDAHVCESVSGAGVPFLSNS